MRLLFLLLLFPISVLTSSCSTSDDQVTDIAEEEQIDDTDEDDTDEDTSSIYFPPNNSTIWESISPESLGWNTSKIPDLLDYLEQRNSKSFMILHRGKIVMENYFDNHTETTPWYWASAGKTLTTAVTGIAQEENVLSISEPVSTYLGEGWTSSPAEKEVLITCKNLLSMNSGLDDSLGNGTLPENLQYVSDAGDRWAYHNVYVKLQDVVSAATGKTWNAYFNEKIKNPIGMTGSWVMTGDFSIYWSNTRSMARYGLLIYADGRWNNIQIIPNSFLSEATNTSQDLNLAYGYMWWLNGKSSFMLPQTQIVFNGNLIPDGPTDMFCALGKNDQKIYIVPSKDLVVVRMGNAAEEENFVLSNFDTVLWQHINAVIN